MKLNLEMKHECLLVQSDSQYLKPYCTNCDIDQKILNFSKGLPIHSRSHSIAPIQLHFLSIAFHFARLVQELELGCSGIELAAQPHFVFVNAAP